MSILETKDIEMEVLDNELDDSSYSISYTVTDRTIQQLREYEKDRFLVLPSFQRVSVWDNKKKSRFIDSLLRGLPVPSLFFYDLRSKENVMSSENYFVVDGHQRLTAVLEFYTNELKINKTSDISKKWAGKYYKDLDESLKRRFRYRTISITLFNQIDSTSNASLPLIFERINTGSTPLGPQEIREALYYSSYVQNAIRISSENKKFAELVVATFSKKMENCNNSISEFNRNYPKEMYNRREFFLRYLAFMEIYKKHSVEKVFTRSLPKYLDNYVEKISDLEQVDIEEKINSDISIFERTIDYIYKHFPKEVFHSITVTEENNLRTVSFNNRIHSTIFDSLMIATTIHITKNTNVHSNDISKKQLLEIYDQIINTLYEDVKTNPFRSGTMSPDNICKRIDLMYKLTYEQ